MQAPLISMLIKSVKSVFINYSTKVEIINWALQNFTEKFQELDIMIAKNIDINVNKQGLFSKAKAGSFSIRSFLETKSFHC